MATDDTNSKELYEQMKTSVRQSFARLYAALKARELRTLRQIQAVKQQCESSHAHSATCLRGVRVSYDNEETIVTDIQHFGELQLDELNLEGHTFLVEDYVCPNEDHMYSYKGLYEIATNARLDLDIEEAALKQITESDCVCSVYITPEEASKRFREDEILKPKPREMPLETSKSSPNKLQNITTELQISYNKNTSNDMTEDSPSREETAKINPTEEWLNCIKSQIETEPTQMNDVMEHSTIVC